MSYDTLSEIQSSGNDCLTTHPEFGAGKSGIGVAKVFSKRIQGKNVVITGVSPNSLGETLAMTFARHSPAGLILASRTLSKLEDVAKSVRMVMPSANVNTVELDLSSQRDVRKAAAKISRLIDHVDILINNAAVVSSERKETIDGLEQTFGTNHIGHFLFTSLLAPLLIDGAAKAQSSGSTRVVNVTSLGYRLSPMRFHDYNFEGKEVPPDEQPPAGLPPHMKPSVPENRPYQGFCAYGQSKTANILHCVSLNRKYASRGVRAFAVHPGSIWTDLSRNLSPDDVKIIEGTSTSWLNHDQGIATILVAALDPKLASAKDQVFLSDCQLSDVAEHAKDPTIAERLWELSEQLTEEHSKL